MLLNNRWVQEDIVREIGKIQDECKENPNIPKLGRSEAVLRKSQSQTTIKKEGISQVNNLNFHLKELGKGQTKLKASNREETIRIRTEINKTKM